jgi:hypothetical protein
LKTFKDNAGRTWTISINVDAIKRVRDALKIDLLDIIGGKMLDEVLGDPVKVVDIIYVLCREEADAATVTDVQFGKAMSGDPIDTATTAFLEELADFFPRRRPVLRAAIARIKQIDERVTAAALAKINGPEMDKLLETELGSLSGGVPASSE